MDGWVAKVDPKTWKVSAMTPVRDPLWAEVSLNDKFGYVTSGADARIYKIELATMKIVGEAQTGPRSVWRGNLLRPEHAVHRR